MAFEKYIPQSNKNRPAASISTLGRLSLNEASVIAFGLENKGFAEFFYDSEESLIGIRFCDKEATDTLRAQRRPNSGLFFSLKTFFKLYNIDYTFTYFCEVRQDGNDKNFIIVDLKTRTERS